MSLAYNYGCTIYSCLNVASIMLFMEVNKYINLLAVR
jgi:hypothetical protein